jgi:hypothetical protein
MTVWESFADGYAHAGPDAHPLMAGGHASARALQHLPPSRYLTETAYTAGVVEGRRAALHRRRMRLYKTDTALIVAALAGWLTTIDAQRMSTDLLGYAQTLPDTTDPVEVRRAVKDRAEAELLHQALLADGLLVAWRTTSTAALQSAAAEGTATALADLNSPAGVPPTVAAVTAARDRIDPTGLAGVAATDPGSVAQQLSGLAGDLAAAVTSPDVRDALDPLDAATTAIRAALDDAEGITFWADEQAHGAASLGFRITLDPVGVGINFVTMGDGRVDGQCLELEAVSPYQPQDLPGIPVHIRCRCWYEVADQTRNATPDQIDVAA